MDKVNLEVAWEVDNNTLKTSINESKKIIEGAGQTVEVVESKVSKNLNNLSQQLNKSKGTFNGLQNSINQIGREMPAFTYSVQTGFMAISNNLPIFFDELGKIRKENELLNASGQKGVPVWKQVLSGMLSWQTAMVVGITLLTVYGKEIGNFFKELFTGKKSFDAVKESANLLVSKMGEAGAAVAKATLEVEDMKRMFQQSKDGIIAKDRVLKTYNEGLGKVLGVTNNLNVAEERTIKNGNAYIDLMFKKAKALALTKLYTEEMSKAAEELAKTDEESVSYMLSGTKGKGLKNNRGEDIYKADAERNRKEAAAQFEERAERFKTLYLKTNDEIELFVKQNGLKIEDSIDSSSNEKNLYKQILEGRKEFIEKIKDLDSEYSILTFSSDDQELATLQKKFADFRKLLEEENRKIKEFNKEKGKNVPIINLDLISPIEEKAKQQLIYKQETAVINKEIEEQKKIYEAYESYKSKLGQTAADEKFKSDLKGFENYSKYLESIISKESEAFAAVDSKTATAGQEDRVKGLQKEAQDAKKVEQQKYTDLLALMINYDQERKNIIERQSMERMQMETSATADQLSEMDRRHREEINKLDDTNIEKLAEVKHLFDGIDQMTDAGARSLIDKVKNLLSSDANISPELREEIQKALKEVTESLDERLPERVLQIADGFSQMAQNLQPVSEELSSVLSGLSNILKATAQVNDGIKNLKKGIQNYQDNKASGGGILGSISAIAGVAGPVGQIVGAVSSVVGGVVNFFKASKESARKAAQELKDYQDSVLAGELEYNRLLRERAREQTNINELTNEQIKLQEKLLKTQIKDAEGDFNSLLKRIQKEGQQITGQKTEKYGGFLGIGKKTRVVDITSGLQGYTYNQLEELYTSNRLSEATKKLFEELKKSKEEIDGIADAWDSMQEVLLDKMSGGATSDAISNSIIDGFKNGKRAVIDFADDAEEIIQNALLSAMAYTVLEEPLQDLVKKFREDSKDGLTKEEIAEFQQGYNTVVQSGLDALSEVEKLTGKTFGKNENSSSNMQSGIERVSEQTASELMGVNRSHLDVSKRNLIVSQKALDIWQNSYSALLQILKHQAAIEQNTAETINQLKLSIVVLKEISNGVGGKYGL